MPLAPIHSIGHCFQTGVTAVKNSGKRVCSAVFDTVVKICRFVYNILVPRFLKRTIEHVLYGPRVKWPVDQDLMARWDAIIRKPTVLDTSTICLKNALTKDRISPMHFEHVFISDSAGVFGADGSFTGYEAEIESGKLNSPKTLFIRAVPMNNADINKKSINEIDSFGRLTVFGFNEQRLPYLGNSCFVQLSMKERGQLQCHELPERLKRLFTAAEIKDRNHAFKIFYGRNR